MWDFASNFCLDSIKSLINWQRVKDLMHRTMTKSSEVLFASDKMQASQSPMHKLSDFL